MSADDATTAARDALPETGPVALANAKQRLAADPLASVWVAASAGSGKTKVLTDRVLSLLLHGSAPARLLCLTFTKAAAAEMANRLARRLSAWAVESDEGLAQDLAKILGAAPAPEYVARARQLFAEVLDVPGGMKIQTIHAFCQSLLARFPLEAGIAPTMQVLDERGAQELLLEARNRVLAADGMAADMALADELGVIAAHTQEQAFSELMAALVHNRARFTQALTASGGAEGLIARLYEVLGVAPDEDAARLLAAAVSDEAFDRAALELVCEALAAGSEKEQEKAAGLGAWLAADSSRRIDGIADHMELFLTKKGEQRKNLLTKGAKAARPAALAAMEAEAGRLQELRGRIAAAQVARANAAFLRLGAAILDDFAACKAARAVLDYDDIILKARDLLARSGAAAWVLYKLDGGLDHVLIDEAQDTNPEQWQVVRSLCEEFFAGEGGREDLRTVFVVGDAKQSIYSFQRADPDEFAAMRAHFQSRVQDANQSWQQVDLGVSFRSTTAVLQAVDAVFAESDARDGVVFDDKPLEHIAVREGQPGVVELWPAAAPSPPAEEAPWSLPAGAAAELPARARLAQLLANRIYRWTGDPAATGDRDCQLASKQRRIEPGDVLVLVRRRNGFFEELVRELKALDVPVAGVDRMVLSDQLAVMDLIALGQAMLLPEDDLTLAAVLKSPLFDLSEEELFDLAYGRPGSLWEALQRAAGQAGAPPAVAAAHKLLKDLLAGADYQPPYEFYAEVLGRLEGRRRLLERLGPEAADAIEEFLNQALLYEQEQLPSLQGFLHWLASGAQEVKRDMEHGDNAVRVMTVHGAKGLQAPIVILPDTLQTPRGHESLLWLESETDLPLWTVKTELDGPAAADARAARRRLQEQEYRRLLYVALTRAEDRLYLCGWQTQNAPPEGCWYNLVARGLAQNAAAAPFDFALPDSFPAALRAGPWAGEAWRLALPETAGEEEAATETPGRETLHRDGAAPEAVPLPDWATTPAPQEPQPTRPLMPSRPSDPAPALRSPLGPQEGARFRRGRLIHKLLQYLPEVPPPDRATAAEKLVAGDVLPSDRLDTAEIVEESLAVLSHPDFADVFGPGSRAEVPIVGLLQRDGASQVISGQVDRLVVRAGRLQIVDFKTNRPVLDNESEVPVVYLRQLAAYRALLEKIYPDKSIDCGLLWTDAPRLMQISDALLAQHAP